MTATAFGFMMRFMSRTMSSCFGRYRAGAGEKFDDDPDVGRDRPLLGGEDRVQVHLRDFRMVGDEPRHVLDHRRERVAIDRIRTADALEDLRRRDAVEHRQRVVLRRGRKTERDVLEHFDQDAAQTEGDQLAEHGIGDRADDHLLAAGEHLLHLDAENVRLRVVLLRVGDEGVEALLDILGVFHADQHASRLGLVQNLRRDDLEHHRKAHGRCDRRRVGGRRRHAFLGNGDPVRLAHQLAFRGGERGAAFGFDGIEHTSDFGPVVEHRGSQSLSIRFQMTFSARRAAISIRSEAEFRQDFVGVLAEQRRPLHVGRTVRHLDRIAHRQVLAARRVIDLDDCARLAQRGLLSDLLHGENRSAGDVVLVEYVHRLELGLRFRPLLDRAKISIRCGSRAFGVAYRGSVSHSSCPITLQMACHTGA